MADWSHMPILLLAISISLGVLFRQLKRNLKHQVTNQVNVLLAQFIKARGNNWTDVAENEEAACMVAASELLKAFWKDRTASTRLGKMAIREAALHYFNWLEARVVLRGRMSKQGDKLYRLELLNDELEQTLWKIVDSQFFTTKSLTKTPAREREVDCRDN